MDTPDSLLNNHLTKCRCCFKHFTNDNKQVKITKIVESRFFEMTQIILKTSRIQKYSNFICELCDNDLERFVRFKNDAITKQKLLYELVDGVKERPKRNKTDVLNYAEDPEDIPFIKVEPKEESEEIQLKECSIVLTPLIKSEAFDVFDTLPHFPDHLYDSDTNDIKNEELTSRHPKTRSDSSSSEDLIEEMFKKLPKVSPKKSKCKKKKKILKIPCKQCNKLFLLQRTLDDHISKVHLRLKNFSCDRCEFVTHAQSLLASHFKRNHEDQMGDNKKKQQCPQCGKFVAELSSHLNQVHAPKKYSCDVCGYDTYSKNRMRKHVWRHLSRDTKIKMDGITCEICGVVLLNKCSLKSHIRNKHLGIDEKNHICHCGKAYKMLSGLKIHQKTAHMPDEQKAKFVCKTCKKRFLHKKSMQDHMLLHQRGSGKDVACHTCGKLYPSLSLLKKHMIFHTDPKYPCPHCGKKYHLPCFVKRHVRNQHEVEYTDCEFCGKALNILTISKHVKEFHSGLERKPCVVPGCGSTYIRKFHMEDHIKRMHREYTNSLTASERDALHEQIKSLKLL